MMPLCKEGDFILLDKLSYFVFRPRVGDVVVLRHPQEERRLLLKYVVKEKLDGNRMFYWVEGVNKPESSDSRNFGWVPRELVLGRAIVVKKQAAGNPAFVRS